ncbi:hypothetical protein ANCCEY_15321 [Ancylostoma ceylanicum]|uniref:Uncharacterized protein n=1 Tax=Ancylostoma ceylanicum TaxID=53326 RepID=A0A0D6LCZ1_9BILA|nr:hypothetical protein ANCCEY_15321 [Ancylostoma ceylanicum]
MGGCRYATNYYINQRSDFLPASFVHRQYLGAVEAVETDSIPTRITVEHRADQLLLIGPSVQCSYGSFHEQEFVSQIQPIIKGFHIVRQTYARNL